MEIAFDITESLQKKKELEQRIKRDNILIDCIRELYQNHHTVNAMNHVLKLIGEVFEAERAYVFYMENDEMSRYFSGSGFEAIDTTGGADSFISALAVLLSEGKSLVYAIGFAIYASGITVTRYGVQPALPERKSVDIFEDEIIEKYKIVEEEK